jgi:TRAP-type mannitol/chloroaromatic compound transport system substrate-binding protein
MKRRDFLTGALGGALGGAAAGALAGCASDGGGAGPAVHTRKKVRWRVASSFPRSLDTIFGAAEVLAERVKLMTDGAFDLTVYPAGELVPGLQVLDAVQQGTVQCGHTASYYYTGKNDALVFDTCVPFGLTARQQTAWLMEGGGLELLREQFAAFNILNFPAGNTGVQMGGWFRNELASLADLQGLKMRIPGLGGEVMARLGVTVQVLAGGDIYAALERGAIDATEWVGPYDDEKLGFHKVAKHYYYPGWWEPGPNLSYYVNQAAWDALPPDFQQVFATAASESASWMQRAYDARNPAAMARLLAAGAEFKPFSDELMRAAQQATDALLEEKASANPAFRKIYDQWRGKRTELNQWFGLAELSYARFMLGA